MINRGAPLRRRVPRQCSLGGCEWWMAGRFRCDVMCFFSIEGGFYLGNYKQQYHTVWGKGDKVWYKLNWGFENPVPSILMRKVGEINIIRLGDKFVLKQFWIIWRYWEWNWIHQKRLQQITSLLKHLICMIFLCTDMYSIHFNAKNALRIGRWKIQRPVPIERPGNEPMAQIERPCFTVTLKAPVLALCHGWVVSWWVNWGPHISAFGLEEIHKLYILYHPKARVRDLLPGFLWMLAERHLNLDSSHMFTPCHFG